MRFAQNWNWANLAATPVSLQVKGNTVLNPISDSDGAGTGLTGVPTGYTQYGDMYNKIAVVGIRGYLDFQCESSNPIDVCVGFSNTDTKFAQVSDLMEQPWSVGKLLSGGGTTNQNASTSNCRFPIYMTTSKLLGLGGKHDFTSDDTLYMANFTTDPTNLWFMQIMVNNTSGTTNLDNSMGLFLEYDCICFDKKRHIN